MLGAPLERLVGRLDKIPTKILVAYWDEILALGERRPQLAKIVKILQTATPRKPKFICIDALDECAAEYPVKLLDSYIKFCDSLQTQEYNVPYMNSSIPS